MIRVYNQFNDYITHRRKEAKSKNVYAEFVIVLEEMKALQKESLNRVAEYKMNI